MATRIQYILAKSLKEAHRFAQDVLGLDRGHYRIVNSPSTLSSVRNGDLHLVNGWDNRFDKFAMRGALKWTRLNVITHEDQDPGGPTLADADDTTEPDLDGLNPPGEQLMIPIDPDEASALLDVDTSNGDNMVFEGSPVAPEPTIDTPVDRPPVTQVITNLEDIKPNKRVRRKRCPECQELFLKEDFDAHVASHTEG